jgi:cytochrome c oxidase subunit 4
MSHSHDEPEVVVLPPDTTKIKKLWTVAAILGVITLIEFFIAFTMHHGSLKTSIFVMLTIIKAAYIVGEFMHLKYESKVMLWTILLPITFIVWMLVAFVYEGLKIGLVRW